MKGSVPYYGATGIFDHVSDSLFDEILLLVGEDGSVVKPDGTPVTQYVWGPSWVNNHAHVITGASISTELAYLALRVTDVRPAITGAVQAKLNMRNLRGLAVALPRAKAIPTVEAEVAPLFNVLRSSADQLATLEALRDALLPELLSGRLRVPEAEELVSDAT